GEAKLIDSTSNPSSALSPIVTPTAMICSRLIGLPASVSRGSALISPPPPVVVVPDLLSSGSRAPLAIPFGERLTLLDEPHEQRRRLPMHRPEDVSVPAHPFEQLRKADRIGVEHRAAAIAREAVARRPHDVDVARAQRDAFLEDADAFVHQRIETALADLLVAVLALLDAELARPLAQNLDRLRIVVARAVAGLVAIVALARLLPEAPRLVEREVGLIIRRVRRILVGVRLVHVHADVDARHVEDREDAHRHAEILEHGIDLPRRRAFEHHALGLARVAFHH